MLRRALVAHPWRTRARAHCIARHASLKRRGRRPQGCRTRHRARRCECAAEPGQGVEASGPAPSSGSASRDKVASIGAHVQRNFVLYGLLSAIVVAIANPNAGLAVRRLGVHKVSTKGIFLISGLTLKLGDVKRALGSPLPLFLGYATILLVLPLSSFLSIRWPFLQPDLVYGMSIFLAMPTALSTGVQISSTCGGNPALALLLTVGANLAAIATLPLLVPRLFGSALELDSGALFASLVRSILAPLVLGCGLRRFVGGLAGAVDANRKKMSLLSGCLLVVVPLVELSRAVSEGLSVSGGEMAQLAGLGLLFPCAFVAFNLATTRLLSRFLPEDARRTLVVVCSIKTLPTAVMVLQKLQESMPALSGIALVPCMTIHLIQTIVVSAFATRWQ